MTIAPGAVIDGRGNEIQTYGVTEAIGSAGNRIRLNDVMLFGGTNPSSEPFALVVQHAEFRGGAVSPSPGYGTVTLRDSRLFDATPPSLWYPTGRCYNEPNIFINCDGIAAGGFFDDTKTVYVTNNVFYGQRTPFAVRAWSQSVPANFQVTRNSFLSTDRIALEIERGHSGQMLGTNNFFNSVNAATIQDMILDKSDDLACPSYIEYVPYLTAPDPATPDPTGLFPTQNATLKSRYAPPRGTARQWGAHALVGLNRPVLPERAREWEAM